MGTCEGFGGVDSSPSWSSAFSFAANAVITKQSCSRKQEKKEKKKGKYLSKTINGLCLCHYNPLAKWLMLIPLVLEQPCLVMAELAINFCHSGKRKHSTRSTCMSERWKRASFCLTPPNQKKTKKKKTLTWTEYPVEKPPRRISTGKEVFRVKEWDKKWILAFYENLLSQFPSPQSRDGESHCQRASR